MCLLRRYRSAVHCCGGRGSGCSRPGYGISPLGGGHHYLHTRATRIQDWGNRLLEGTNKTLCTPGLGERGSDPTRNRPRLARECPGVSSRGAGRRWPAAGLGALNAAVRAWDLLKEGASICITSTIVWPPMAKQWGGNTAPPINRKLD